MANEQLEREWVPGKGLVETWVVKGDQHLLDGAAMAAAAGDKAGYDMGEILRKTAAQVSKTAKSAPPVAATTTVLAGCS